MSPSLTKATPVGLVVAGRPLLGWLTVSGFFLAVLGGTYFIVRKVILEVRKRKLLQQAGTSSADGLAIGYANRCYAAMFRGNTEWWNDTIGDGTDEDALFQVAREMRANGITLAQVSDKYKVLYDRQLLQDITKELDSADNAKFQNILATGLGSPANVPLLVTHRLLSTAPTLVYNEQMEPVNAIGGGSNLGGHIGTMFAAGNQVYHEFLFQGQLRRVPAGAVRLQAV